MSNTSTTMTDSWTSTSPEETRQIASDCVREWSAGRTVGLVGPLGSGKTTFVKGVIGALGGPGDQVRSPTYTLLQCYDELSPTVVHVDLYRTEDPLAQETIGLEDYFGRALVLVEWADRWERGWPEDTVTIEFRHQDPGTREIRFHAVAPDERDPAVPSDGRRNDSHDSGS